MVVTIHYELLIQIYIKSIRKKKEKLLSNFFNFLALKLDDGSNIRNIAVINKEL